MACVLQILGESFDPSTAPELLALRPYAAFRRGDPNPSGLPGFTEVGGLSCEVSPRKRMIDLVGHATAYLVRHREVLLKMGDHDAITTRSLSFHITPQEFQTIESRVHFPSLMLRQCAELRLGITFMVV
jgi:hypothetical protein